MGSSDNRDDQPVDPERIRDVLERFPIRLGVLFGSRARGTGGPHSDVDVAIEFDRSLSDDRRRRARLEALVDLSRSRRN